MTGETTNPVHERPGSMSRALSYALLADTDEERIKACTDAIAPFGLGVLVAKNAHEALEALERFGPPVLLMVDLLLPPAGGFSVIESTRQPGSARAGIVAWSAARELREFALCRLADLNVRVLGAASSAALIDRIVGRLIRGESRARAAAPLERPDESAVLLQQRIRVLSARARDLCHTAGVAVYLRGDEDERFTASATWAPEEPVPQSLEYLPQALNHIIETREPFVALDVARDRESDASPTAALDAVGGIVAVPLFGDDQHTIVGMLCVFDLKPLALTAQQMDALKALGRPQRGIPLGPLPTVQFSDSFERAGPPARGLPTGVWPR